MGDGDEKLIALLVKTVENQSTQISNLIRQVAALESTVKHLEEQMRRETRQVQANLEDAVRTDERFALKHDQKSDGQSVRAWYVSLGSLVVATSTVLWNVIWGKG